jgi:mono/diheme cytochrome c family protein
MTVSGCNGGHGGRATPALILMALLFGYVWPAAAGSLTERGKALVELNCAGCHATGTTGKSSHPDAPPFRVLSRRYPITDLEEALAEGISTGHPDMPEWVASPDQIDAIIAYIASIQQP